MVATKTPLDKKQAVAMIETFFKQFQTCCNRPKPPIPSDFDKVLSRNFEMTSNGQTVCKNLESYCQRLDKMQKKWNKFEVSAPLEEPLVCGNKISVNYEGNFTTPTGQKNRFFFMASATVEDNKFTNWTQVAHQQGTGNLDTLNIL